jgi:hypothetical protein
MASRLSVSDAMRDIRAVAPPSKNVYSAILNADGSIKMTQNNITVLNQNFWWNLTGNFASAKTDANGGSNDTVVIEDSDGSNPRASDFQQWLNTLTQFPNRNWNLFLTVVSTHTALLLAFQKGLKVDDNFKAFRRGESEFYDLYRRLLDRPKTFGNSEEEQLDAYFADVESVRKCIRNAETDNLASVQGAEQQGANQVHD